MAEKRNSAQWSHFTSFPDSCFREYRQIDQKHVGECISPIFHIACDVSDMQVSLLSPFQKNLPSYGKYIACLRRHSI